MSPQHLASPTPVTPSILINHMESDEEDLLETCSVRTVDEHSLFANDLSDRESTDGSLVAVSLVADSEHLDIDTDTDTDDDERLDETEADETPGVGQRPFLLGSYAAVDHHELDQSKWSLPDMDHSAFGNTSQSSIELIFPDPASSCSSDSTFTEQTRSLPGIPHIRDRTASDKRKEYAEHYDQLMTALQEANRLERWLQDRKQQTSPDDSSLALMSDEQTAEKYDKLMRVLERANALESWLWENKSDRPLPTGLPQHAARQTARPVISRGEAGLLVAENKKKESPMPSSIAPEAVMSVVGALTELACIFARLVDAVVAKTFRGWIPLILFLTIFSDIWYQFSASRAAQKSFEVGAGQSGLLSADTGNLAGSAVGHSGLQDKFWRVAWGHLPANTYIRATTASATPEKKSFVLPSGRERIRRHIKRLREQSKVARMRLRSHLQNTFENAMSSSSKATLKSRMANVPAVASGKAKRAWIGVARGAQNVRTHWHNTIARAPRDIDALLDAFGLQRKIRQPVNDDPPTLRARVKCWLHQRRNKFSKRISARLAEADRSKLRRVHDILRHVAHEYVLFYLR